ncbi:MAG TPA: RNA-binding protein [Chitinophagaceae bacterium]
MKAPCPGAFLRLYFLFHPLETSSLERQDWPLGRIWQYLKKKSVILPCIGVLSVSQVLNFSQIPVNVHWLLFTVGTICIFKFHNTMNIYVGNLSWNLKDQDLSNLFASHGEVVSAKIVTDKFTNRSKGFGFVEMANDDQAQAAITALNGSEVDGRNIVVNESRPKPEGGGGGGFKKRSFGGGGGGGGFKKGGYNKGGGGGYNRDRGGYNNDY